MKHTPPGTEISRRPRRGRWRRGRSHGSWEGFRAELASSKFFRASPDGSPGAGLGMLSGIVEAHGGSIRAAIARAVGHLPVASSRRKAVDASEEMGTADVRRDGSPATHVPLVLVVETAADTAVHPDVAGRARLPDHRSKDGHGGPRVCKHRGPDLILSTGPPAPTGSSDRRLREWCGFLSSSFRRAAARGTRWPRSTRARTTI